MPSSNAHDRPWDYVRTIIDRFGPRAPGSEAEAAAQGFVEADFRQLFGNATAEPFASALDAKFQSLRLFVPLCWGSLILAWWSLPLAALLALANAVLFFGHFVRYRDWLDRFWPARRSSNVWADLEPQEQAVETIILAGHVDSATEFRWWYRWGQSGLVATIVGGFGLVLTGLILPLLALWAGLAGVGAGLGNPDAGAWTSGWFLVDLPALLEALRDQGVLSRALVWGAYSLSALAAIPAFTLWFIHGRRGVDGAIDNLSALAMARALGQRLADPAQPGRSLLRHTRLRIMSFGSEECGLKGSRAYVRLHAEALRAEAARLLNIESYRDARMTSVIGREWFTGARYPSAWQAELLEAFAEGGLPAQKQDLMLGATDATSFALAGLPAICLIGLDAERLDPTYHTRRDNLEHLDPEGMEAVVEVLVAYLRKRDGGWASKS
jgi:hypothetical protein